MGSFIPFISHLQEISRHYLETKTILHVPHNISDATDSKHLSLKRKRCQNLICEEEILKKSCSSPYKCCGIDFKYASSLEIHKKTLSHQGLVLCLICRIAVKKEDIWKHRAEFHERYKCCGLYFKNARKLEEHKKTLSHQGLVLRQICSKAVKKEDIQKHRAEFRKQYKCCGIDFKKASSLEIHKKTLSHQGLVLCQICSKAVKKEDIQKHRAEFHKQYKCCGIDFKYASKLEEHKKTLSHQGLVLCQICSKAVKKEDIWKHRAEFHERYKCCGLYFKNARKLEEHQRSYAHQSVVLSKIDGHVVQKEDILEHRDELH